MRHDSDVELDEMMEEMAEDLGRKREQEMNHHRPGGRSNLSSGGPFWAGGAVLIILIAVIISFLFRGKGISEGDLESVTNGLARIEKRLGKMEEIEKKTAELEKQVKNLRDSIGELERFKTASDKRLGSLSHKIEKNEERISVQQKNPGTKLSESSPGTGQYHIVKKGETLYRISRKYGVKIEDLRRMNDLKSSEDIYPNQRLVIRP